MQPLGGTELQYAQLYKHVDNTLLDKFQITTSIPEKIPLSKDKIKAIAADHFGLNHREFDKVLERKTRYERTMTEPYRLKDAEYFSSDNFICVFINGKVFYWIRTAWILWYWDINSVCISIFFYSQTCE